MTHAETSQPDWATGALVLADGTVFWGRGVGAVGDAVGEVCFNTSITGYQEILTDPSYAAQIINFTFPHIGNVGANPDDIEATTPAARGCVLRADITEPSNWRAAQPLTTWLASMGLIGLAGIDTRRVTRRIRDGGAPHGAIVHAPDGRLDIAALQREAAAWPGLVGMDLAQEVSCRQTYSWDETAWELGRGYGATDGTGPARRRRRLRRQAQYPAQPCRPRLPGHGRPGHRHGGRRAGPRARRRLPGQRTRRPSGDRNLCRADDSRGAGHRHPAVRHLPRPPVAGPGARRPHREDASRPPWRQSSGPGPGDRPGRDHQPEPRFRRSAGQPARQRDGHSQVAVRRLARRPAPQRRAGVLRPVPPGGVARPPGQPPPVPPVSST